MTEDMADVVIVGAGLFGSIIDNTLQREGLSTILVDYLEPLAGSPPAGCLMKPGWLSAFNKKELEEIFKHLGELYNLQTITFQIHPSGVYTPIKHIHPQEILSRPKTMGMVVDYKWMPRLNLWEVKVSETVGNMRTVRCAELIFANGIWARTVDPLYENVLKPRVGISFFINNAFLEQPFIKPWAPYKQVVAFNMNIGRIKGIWISDGVAVKPETFEKGYREKCFNRCRKALLPEGIDVEKFTVHRMTGTRPYYSGGRYLLDHPREHMWIASGGGKNGTVAAAHAALRIKEKLV